MTIFKIIALWINSLEYYLTTCAAAPQLKEWLYHVWEFMNTACFVSFFIGDPH